MVSQHGEFIIANPVCLEKVSTQCSLEFHKNLVISGVPIVSMSELDGDQLNITHQTRKDIAQTTEDVMNALATFTLASAMNKADEEISANNVNLEFLDSSVVTEFENGEKINKQVKLKEIDKTTLKMREENEIKSAEKKNEIGKSFIKPKDIILSSRQKSHIMAHKAKAISAPLISKEALTMDLMGATKLKGLQNRDTKNVEEMMKEFVSQASCQEILCDLVQRSPIPVPFHNNRRSAAAPYLALCRTHCQDPTLALVASATDHENKLDQSTDMTAADKQLLPIDIQAQPTTDVLDGNAGIQKLHEALISLKNQNVCSSDVQWNQQVDYQLTELPDTLSDFILNFSGLYSKRHCSAENDASINAKGSGNYNFSVGDSPMDSLAFQLHKLSEQPHQGDKKFPIQQNDLDNEIIPDSSTEHCNVNFNKVAPAVEMQILQSEITIDAKIDKPCKSGGDILKAMISNAELSKAWMWAVRCSQACTGALYYRDADGDSLLHIVVWHRDFGKIYSLTELMNRENDHSYPKPFDLKNLLDETPLFLAVEKRLKEIVAFGLEHSVDPNSRAICHNMDAPLHYAASRGMTDIVVLLCQSPLINLNLYNGSGLTPLLCALKNHRKALEGGIETIDNISTIKLLLEYGANLRLRDTNTGKTAFHYVVECMEPSLIQLFRDHYDKEILQKLVNQKCFSCETPLCLLDRIVNQFPEDRIDADSSDSTRKEMLENLLICGAEWPQILAQCDSDSSHFIYTF